MNFAKLLVRIAFDYLNVLRELALYSSLHFACIITHTFIKNREKGHHHRYNPMIPVKTKTETVAIINHQNLSAVKNNVKTATKLSQKKIQVKAKTPKLDPENNATKS